MLSYAVQVGEALEEAHSRGIIHRDVKSDNIMVTAKGQVKVMDFGLAKLKGALRLTKSTSTIGTLAYMAPEQLQGKETDARMDIFSFGVVLYEMLTGHLPFRGEYESALMYSILNTEPEPVTKYRPDLSSEFLHVLNRALEKDPDDRYLSVKDMLVDLRRLKRDTSKVIHRPSAEMLTPEAQMQITQATGAVPVERPEMSVGANGRSPLRYAATAITVIILAVSGYLLLFYDAEPPVPQFTNPTPVTTAIRDNLTWSPDGIRLAYDYQGDIWVIQIPGGTPINLTADHMGGDFSPCWSPDGRLIAFRSNRNGPGYYIMSSIGGPPRRIPISLPPFRGSNPTWLSNGTELALMVEDSTGVLAEIISLEDFSSRLMPLPGEGTRFRYTINGSPEGNYIAYVVTDAPSVSNSQLWIVRTADGVGFPVTEGKSMDLSPFWSGDGQFLYFISDRGGGRDLWRLRIGKNGVPGDTPQRVTTGIEMRSAVFSPDETKLAYVKDRQIGAIWQFPILRDRAATLKDGRQLTFEQSYIWTADISADGTRIVFDSKRDGKWHLWTMPIQGGRMERVTIDPMDEYWPRWSPDGREIAFYGSKEGKNDIYIVPVGGGSLRRITKDAAEDIFPAWSPDGSKIAFASSRSGNEDIWIIPANGGEARQLTDDPAADLVPAWSPDGKWVLFRSDRTGENRLWRVPAEGGNPEPVTNRFGYTGTWSPDGKKVYFISREGDEIIGNKILYEVTIDGGIERIVADLGEVYYVDPLVTDGKSLFTVLHDYIKELWVMDVVK